MSKMDNLRAMREARYERTKAQAKSTTGAPAKKAPVAPAAGTSAPKTSKADATPAPAGDADELCGHRSMNGRTCTREKGHSAKSHRYS